MAADMYEKLLPEFGLQGLMELAQRFVTDANKRLSTIVEAEAEGDVAEVALQVHTLKGAAMTVGFQDVERWANNIEAGELALSSGSVGHAATLLRAELLELELIFKEIM